MRAYFVHSTRSTFDVAKNQISLPRHDGDIIIPVGDRRCLLAKKPTEGRRKLVEFDAQTWHALNLLSRDSIAEASTLMALAWSKGFGPRERDDLRLG